MIEQKTAEEWNADPRNRSKILSWSDFGRNAYLDGITESTPITWRMFKRLRNRVTCVWCQDDLLNGVRLVDPETGKDVDE